MDMGIAWFRSLPIWGSGWREENGWTAHVLSPFSIPPTGYA